MYIISCFKILVIDEQQEEPQLQLIMEKNNLLNTN